MGANNKEHTCDLFKKQHAEHFDPETSQFVIHFMLKSFGLIPPTFKIPRNSQNCPNFKHVSAVKNQKGMRMRKNAPHVVHPNMAEVPQLWEGQATGCFAQQGAICQNRHLVGLKCFWELGATSHHKRFLSLCLCHFFKSKLGPKM